jgi:hypothetical protein
MSLPPWVSLPPRGVLPQPWPPGRPSRPTYPSPHRELPTGRISFPSGSAHPPYRVIACGFPLLAVDGRLAGGPTTGACIARPTPYLVVRARNVAYDHPESHPFALQKSECCCANERLCGGLLGHAIAELATCRTLLHNTSPWQYVCAWRHISGGVRASRRSLGDACWLSCRVYVIDSPVQDGSDASEYWQVWREAHVGRHGLSRCGRALCGSKNGPERPGSCEATGEGLKERARRDNPEPGAGGHRRGKMGRVVRQ